MIIMIILLMIMLIIIIIIITLLLKENHMNDKTTIALITAYLSVNKEMGKEMFKHR